MRGDSWGVAAVSGMMMLGVTSPMPADEGCLHLGSLELGMLPVAATSSPSSLLRFSPLPAKTTTKTEDRLSVSLLAAAATADTRLATAAVSLRRRLSPPIDDLNTPATFTPTYSCGHFVFDAVGDFALTAVDDLPTTGTGR